jgi:glycosyltransferase involved in cell wall biosynthesis
VPPRVSIVVPARDEAAHITACIRSIQAQDVDGDIEIIVVDGCSSDATAELARAAGAKVVENLERITPTALNRGLDAAEGEILIRFDAHSEMAPGYIAACLQALDEEEAVNVGGWCDVRGAGPWGRAVGAALASRFGVGNPRLWRPPRAGEGRRDVDSVPFGCFPTAVLRDVGGWRADLVRNQDFELNYRLRLTGGRVVFDPAIRFVYRPRESVSALWRQYWHFGRWKANVLVGSPRSVRPRQLAPIGLLTALSLAAFPGPAAPPARTAVAGYTLLLTVLTVRARNWRLFPVLVTIHLAWGTGLAAGIWSRVTPRAGRRLRTMRRRHGATSEKTS